MKSAKMRSRHFVYLAFLAVLIGGITTSASLDDVSNNLASDLGPLLALFGEEMTKQFLSESTYWVDYLIFSMAPIGIITAIVSVIRVCGAPSLRAFIGRAQEGDGEIEAELCTSTGRDVCELFNSDGGITRVLGRPRILEVIHYWQGPKNQQQRAAQGTPVGNDPTSDGDIYGTGVFLLRHHLTSNSPLNGWEKNEGYDGLQSLASNVYRWTCLHFSFSKSSQACRHQKEQDLENSKSDNGVSMEKPSDNLASKHTPKRGASAGDKTNPNLSLNVGITKIPKGWFYAVAVLGLVLQFGVMVMAGILTWKFQYTEQGPPDHLVDLSAAINENRWPISFIIGTGLITIGMFFCAAFIGEKTIEEVYKRRTKGQDSQILWLQPGNQTIGDQTFYPFAYAEDMENKLPEYMSSEKVEKRNTKHLVGPLVVVTLVGFISQFIGLRGMHASISIAQLGIMIIMSFLRGVLRMQRLSNEDNKLKNIQDQVLGHELDWLAFNLWRRHLEASKIWKISDKGGSADLTNETSFEYKWSLVPCAGSVSIATEVDFVTRTESTIQESQSLITKLFHYRARLAHLTGHSGASGVRATRSQEWHDDQVAVRQKAREIATAVCSVAEGLIGRTVNFKPINIVIEVQLSHPSLSESERGCVLLQLEPPKPASGAGWTMDSSEIEAILGLWVWSLKNSHGVHSTGRNREGDDENTHESTAQIFSFSINEQDHATHDIRRWMLNFPQCPISKIKVADSNYREVGTKVLWEGSPGSSEDCPSTWVPYCDSKAPVRFFGWSSAPPEVRHQPVNIQVIPRKESKVDVTVEQTALELFAIILTRLNDFVGIDIGNMELSSDIPMVDREFLVLIKRHTARGDVDRDAHWKLPKLSDACSRFQDSGLGSWVDGMLIMVPALRLTAQPEVITQLIIDATTKSKAAEAFASEAWLHLACRDYILEKIKRNPHAELLPYQERLLVALGELYRRLYVTAGSEQGDTLPGPYTELPKGVNVMCTLFADVTEPEGNTNQFNKSEVTGGSSTIGRYAAADGIENVFRRYLKIDLPPDFFDEVDRSKAIRSPPRELQRVAVYLEDVKEELKSKEPADERLIALKFISDLGGRRLEAVPMDHISDMFYGWLEASAVNNWPEVTIAILDEAGFRPKYFPQVVIDSFIKRGDLFMVKKSIEHGAKMQPAHLKMAIRYKQLGVVKYLLQTGNLDPNEKDLTVERPSFASSTSTFITAIVYNQLDDQLDDQLETIYFFLNDLRTDAEVQNAQKLTPLHFAAISGSEMTVKLLIHNSAARFVADDSGMTPLHLAPFGGHKTLLKTLYDHGRRGGPMWEALEEFMWEALEQDESTERSLDVVKALLEYQCSPDEPTTQKNFNLPDNKGRTALHYAAGWGFQETVKLLAKVINPEAQDNDGKTALYYANMRGRERAVELLVRASEKRKVDSGKITKGSDAVEDNNKAKVKINIADSGEH